MSVIRRIVRSAGGRGNEIGGAHRAGFAAYLAAYGLAGESFAGWEDISQGHPIELAMEQGEERETDDLLCRLSDGATALVQATSECGMSKKLFATARQWLADLDGPLDGRTFLVLACGKAKGDLSHLSAAFQRSRNTAKTPFLPKERKSLEDFAAALPDVDIRKLEAVQRRAVVVELQVKSYSDPSFREAARLLEGLVVEFGHGRAAMQALSEHFRQMSSKGGGSDVEQWVDVLRKANIPLMSDKDGGAVARNEARLERLAQYRSRTAEGLDVLRLDEVVPGVAPLACDSLATAIRVLIPDEKAEQDSLLDVARQHKRFGVVASGGFGKSVATEQLAAWLAANGKAPIPIRVRLKSINGIDPKCHNPLLELVSKCDYGSDTLSVDLVSELTNGFATLILDGLDECGTAKADVVEVISRAIDMVGADAGVIVTARPSAEQELRRLKLTHFNLAAPVRFEETLEALTRHLADEWGVSDKSQWIADRLKWLEESRQRHERLWSIPLMAVHLTVLVAESHVVDLPMDEPRLLWRVITESIRKWEERRFQGGTHSWPTSSAIDAKMLEFGLAEIGHELREGPISRAELIERLGREIALAWMLGAPPASQAAEDVVDYWEECGIVTRADDLVQPRAELYADIGDAMWVLRQSESVRSGWVSARVANRKGISALRLAAALDASIREVIAREAAVDPRSALLVSDVLKGLSPVSAESADCLVATLRAKIGDQSEDTSSPGLNVGDARRQVFEKRDGPSWKYQKAIAQLPMPTESRSMRDVLIAEEQDVTKAAVLHALSITSDLRVDSRAPDADERLQLARFLEIEVPERETAEPKRVGRTLKFETRPPLLLSGHLEAVVDVLDLVLISEDEARKVAALSHRGSFADAMLIDNHLRRLGFEEVAKEAVKSLNLGLQNMNLANLAEGFYAGNKRLLGIIGSWGETQRECSLPAAWYRPNLLRLMAVLDFRHVSLWEMGFVTEKERETVAIACAAMARACGIDRESVASEALRVLEELDGDEEREEHELLTLMCPLKSTDDVDMSTEKLDFSETEVELLQQGLLSPSPWLFTLSLSLLEWSHFQNWNELVNLIPRMTVSHRTSAAVAILNRLENVDELVDKWAVDESNLRCAVVRVAYVSEGRLSDDRRAQLIEQFMTDDDLRVRVALAMLATKGGNDELVDRIESAQANNPAWTWSCSNCNHVNGRDDEECVSCTHRSRPEMPRREIVNVSDVVDELEDGTVLD